MSGLLYYGIQLSFQKLHFAFAVMQEELAMSRYAILEVESRKYFQLARQLLAGAVLCN